MATNGKRNRSAGHNYERDEVIAHRKYFKFVATTRSCNRDRDNKGIDLANPNEIEVGRFPIDASLKTSYQSRIDYAKLLDEMESSPNRIKAIFHRRTRKSDGGKFMVKGEYVVLERKGYEVFLQHLFAIQLMKEEYPEFFNVLTNLYGLNLLDFINQLHPRNDRDTTNDGPSRKALGTTPKRGNPGR